jgi:hypothetical protein
MNCGTSGSSSVVSCRITTADVTPLKNPGLPEK